MVEARFREGVPAGLLCRGPPLGQVDKPTLRQAISSITTGGTTNLSGRWLKGLEQLQSVAADWVRRVLLLTDGQANRGITDAESLTGLARQAGAAGVGATTIGFGADFNELLLTAIADAGRGNAWFAETIDDAPGIFADELGCHGSTWATSSASAGDSSADADAMRTTASAAAQGACEQLASGMRAAVATALNADNEPPDANMPDRPIRADTTDTYM